MKYLQLALTLLLLVVETSNAQTYSPVDESGTVKFVIANLGINVDGSLKGIKGKIVFDDNNLLASSFDVTVETVTINTGNNTRDKHLRGKDYFNAVAHPQLKITSARVAKSVTPGYYVLYGKLSIKSVTKEISFPFKTVAENGGLRFTGSFKIKRRDFGVGGRSTVSNDVDIKLNVFAKKL